MSTSRPAAASVMRSPPLDFEDARFALGSQEA
jgi:hypothetical protein